MLGLLPMGCGRVETGSSALSATLPNELTVTGSPATTAVDGTAPPESARTGSADVETVGTDEPSAVPIAAASPDLAAERILLLLPREPLIVELRITIDGLPFRTPREGLVTEMLEAADRDGDGRATWGEVFADPKRIFGERLVEPLNFSNRKQFLKANDTNRNGLVDRDEARRFIEQIKRSEAAFALQCTTERRGSDARQSIVGKLLDVDGNETLDPAELAALEQRLLARDANDDRTVSWTEFDDSLVADELAVTRKSRVNREEAIALLLGPNADWEAITGAIERTYLEGGGPINDPIPSGGSLVGRLDANGDGNLTAEEASRLDGLPPQVTVSAHFGACEPSLPRFSAVCTAPDGRSDNMPIAQEHDHIALRLAGCRLEFVLDAREPETDEAPSAQTRLTALDTDKNGYLERTEAAGFGDTMFFAESDTNADGKIFLDELAAYLRRHRAPRLGAVGAVVRGEQDAIFSLLDTNGDKRLTTRELRGGATALREVDADGDGRIGWQEIPGTLSISVGRGQPSPATATQGPSTKATEPPPAGPKWFVSMDANRDQEVSREEFPGSDEKFRRLDSNGDGFIVANEAYAAEQR